MRLTGRHWKVLPALALAALLAPSAAFAVGAHASGQAAQDDAPAMVEQQAPGGLSVRKNERRGDVAQQLFSSEARPAAAEPSEPRGEVYEVATLDELNKAVEDIKASDAAEATVLLSADLYDAQRKAGTSFPGVPGKLVMLSSVSGARHRLYLSHELQGGLVLDTVSPYFDGAESLDRPTVYASGNTLETTDNFTGTIHSLYGGGAPGKDVAGDCAIVIRGGSVTFLHGGGLDSNVNGNVHITIDAPTAPGSIPNVQSVSSLYGGGHAKHTDNGRVSGDVTIDFRSGSNGGLFGGGQNEFNADAGIVASEAAMVSGTVTVNLGYKGAPARSVWPGAATFSYAGSFYSTVGNVRLNILDGCTGKSTIGDRNFYGCGQGDTVLGTVEVNVDGFDAGSSFVYFGGDIDQGYYLDGNVNILNRGGEEYAVRVTWNTPMENFDGSAWAGVQANNEDIPLHVNGGVLIDIQSGYLAFAKTDNEASDSGSAVIEGDSVIRVSGNAKIAQVEGNFGEYKSEDETYRTRVLLDGESATLGYLYRFDEVRATNGAQVLIDGAKAVFPMFDSTQNPFYSVNDLVVDGDAYVTTRNSSTKVMRDVKMNAGTWHAKGYVYVYEAMDTKDSSILWDTYYQVGYNHWNDDDPTVVTSWKSFGDTVVTGYNQYLNRVYGNVEVSGGVWSLLSRTNIVGHVKANDLLLQLPVIAEGENYPEGSIPLEISGIASGHADVETVSRAGLAEGMDATAWKGEPVVPTLMENYITSWAPQGVGNGEGQDNPVQAVFTLASGVQGPEHYFLKRLPDADDDYADSYYMWQVADGFAVTFDKNNTDEGATEADPKTIAIPANPGDQVALGKLPGEPTRPGYEFEGWYANPEGTGEQITADTMVDGDVTFYAKWSVAATPDPDPDPDPEPGPNPGPNPDPEPGPNPGPQPDPQPGPNPQPGPQPNPQPGPNPGPEPNLNPQSGTGGQDQGSGEDAPALPATGDLLGAISMLSACGAMAALAVAVRMKTAGTRSE